MAAHISMVKLYGFKKLQLGKSKMRQLTKEAIELLLDVKEKYMSLLEDSINDFIVAVESGQDDEVKSAFYMAKEKCYLCHLNIDGAIKDTFESLGYKEEN